MSLAISNPQIVLCVFLLYLTDAQAAEGDPTNPPKGELPPTCESKIYCQGELLRVVQMAKIHPDSKTFVDMSMLLAPADVEKNFEKLMEASKTPDKKVVEEFLFANFAEGKELDAWDPEDFEEKPAFLKRIKDSKLQTFASDLIQLWKVLGKKVNPDVEKNPDKYSLIHVPNGFIVPGGRFREFYYWDSYWVIQGLLISGMHETARGMIENFLSMVDRYGFVPNGGRIYYLNRSQPPLLNKMAYIYYKETKNSTWVTQNIDRLAKELQFWLDKKFVKVEKDGKTYNMATYIAESQGPRPESYSEDINTASLFATDEEKQQCYNELKGAAQSGWDFSTRWIFDEEGGTNANISYTKISRVIPVDLNAILYGAFSNMAELYNESGQAGGMERWKGEADKLVEAMQAVLWDPTDEIWYDFDKELKKPRKHFVASNLAPLWTKAYTPQDSSFGAKAVKYLQKEGIPDFKGGIPTSKVNSKEQWDMPNAWPPLQSIVANGLLDSGDKDAMDMAKKFAEAWVNANMAGFTSTKQMFEKYDAVTPGVYGGGGEYMVQIGFGWSNGVVLEFIDRFIATPRSAGATIKKDFVFLFCVASVLFVV